ncbi:glycosyltransferase [Dysgonomonadaceae bacterium zrk40]|nr:glycosyltransferase [Dysgonomonadaceae bacterium zrk40]
MNKTSVIILNWNGKKLLQQFLPSVAAHTTGEDCRLIVADNGSSDDSVAFLQAEFPHVELICFDHNHGFAEGYNRAIEQVDSEYVILLNSDVETTEGWVQPLVSYLDAHQGVAAVQPTIRSFHQKSHFEYAGAAGGYIDRYGYPFCRGRILETVEPDRGQYRDEIPVFWASGASLCIRRSDYLNAGGLDGLFFAHMEEIDLCWRLNARGRGVVSVPSSVVYHVGAASLSKENPRKLYLNFRNNLLMLYKNLPRKRLIPTFFVRFIFDFMAAVHLLIQGKFRSSISVVKAYRDFLTMRFSYSHKRRENMRLTTNINLPGTYRSSILMAYYLRNKRTYGSLFSKK